MSDELVYAKDLASIYETAIHGLRKSGTIARLVERIEQLEGDKQALLAENKQLRRNPPALAVA